MSSTFTTPDTPLRQAVRIHGPLRLHRFDPHCRRSGPKRAQSCQTRPEARKAGLAHARISPNPRKINPTQKQFSLNRATCKKQIPVSKPFVTEFKACALTVGGKMIREERVTAVLAITVLSTLATCAAFAQTEVHASAPAAPTAATTPTVELVKALAWPVVALLIAGIFRRPAARFVSALGSRITKLSLFKVELELVPASAATATPLLDDIRTATNSATISDSSRMMLEQVQSGTQADFALVALGGGEEWLTSRLYVAAVMMERMRNVKVFVFVERAPTTERRLVAVVPLRQLRWTLARRYPWLEAAWARSLLSVFPEGNPPNAPVLPAGAKWLPDPPTLSVPQHAT